MSCIFRPAAITFGSSYSHLLPPEHELLPVGSAAEEVLGPSPPILEVRRGVNVAPFGQLGVVRDEVRELRRSAEEACASCVSRLE